MDPTATGDVAARSLPRPFRQSGTAEISRMNVPAYGVALYWLPIGAGGTGFVRLNGQLYEALTAFWHGRERCDLYHAGLEIKVPEGRFTVEQTPAGGDGLERGVVGVGPIAARWLAERVPLFRYELRCWRDGVIPDVEEAADSPRWISEDPSIGRRVLELMTEVPMLVWGRDELNVGDMWNSNSQIAWLLSSAGLDGASIAPPPNGRAPGWHAGLVAAAAGLTRTPTRRQGA